ncbi:hypothetical protein ACFX1S_041039 [Malus domestica]
MSSGIQDVRAEDIVAIRTESGVQIKTAVRRGGYVKDVYARRFTMRTMKWAFWMTGNYGSHADGKYDKKKQCLRSIILTTRTWWQITEQWLQADHLFIGICISNVTIRLVAKAKQQPWMCSDVEGITSGVMPRPCDLLPDQSAEKATACDFPADDLPIDLVELKQCTYMMSSL